MFMEQMKRFINWLETADEGQLSRLCSSIGTCARMRSLPFSGERAQHRALSEESLSAISGSSIQPWLSTREEEEEEESSLVRRGSKACTISVCRSKTCSTSTKTRETLELLLTRPTELLQEDYSNCVWSLVDILLDEQKRDDSRTILVSVWNSYLNGNICRSSSTFPKLMLHLKDVFHERLEHVVRAALNESGDGDLNVRIVDAVASSEILFASLMDFLSRRFKGIGFESKSFRKCAKPILWPVKNASPNFPSIFPLWCQHLVVLLETPAEISSDNEAIFLELLAEQGGKVLAKSPVHFWSLLVLYPEWFQRTLRHSAKIAGRFHVNVVSADASIKELFYGS